MDLSPRNAVEAVGIPATIGNWAVFPGAVLSWKNRIILFSGDVDEGNSGGPLLAGGAVVGMVMRALRFGEAIPALNLEVFLRNNGVAWASAGGAIPPVRPSDAAKPSPLARPETAPAVAKLQRPGPKPGETFRDCPTCPEMVVIPAGTFQMGSPEGEPGRTEFEGPVHTVTFDRPFAIARHEVTFDQWDACVRDGGCQHRPDDAGWGRGARPVIYVTWKDAKEYVQWLSRKTGQDYRLPGEAEWEYAARAGTKTARFWGEDPDAACRYANVYDETHKGEQAALLPLPKHNCNDGYAPTAPVAQFEANAFGLNDMLGNVWEWTEDCWDDSYRGAPSDGSAWTKGDCGRRVLRGGSWVNRPDVVRSASRFGYVTGDPSNFTGFRPARTL
jgi:formylglycine-generating enzyme required for sulfatase activity